MLTVRMGAVSDADSHSKNIMKNIELNKISRSSEFTKAVARRFAEQWR